jgi:hypothetical protein
MHEKFVPRGRPGTTLEYQSGEGRESDPRCPELLRGNPEEFERQVALMTNKNKWASNILGFEGNPDQDVLDDVMDLNDAISFVGFEPHRFMTTWIKHKEPSDDYEHRTALHSNKLSLDLETGKGVQTMFAPKHMFFHKLAQDIYNIMKGLPSPMDPKRAQPFEDGDEKKRKDPEENSDSESEEQ